MRRIRWFLPCLILFASLSSHAQNATASPESIKDPQAILEAVAPSYDFDNPALKPWYLKATYELYSVDGASKEEGTYERWWVSPGVFRSTWTRGNNVNTIWHADGDKMYFRSSGDPVHLIEENIPALLLFPLPKAPGDYDPAKDWLQRYILRVGKVELPCVRVTSKGLKTPPLQWTAFVASYCFDPKAPIVITRTYADGISAVFSQYARFQNRDLPRSVAETADGRKLLTLTVDSVNSILPGDPALIPPPDATTSAENVVPVGADVMTGRRLGGPMPEYPDIAKYDRIQGDVILEAEIGADGKVRDLQAISSPSRFLTDAAEKAVSRWVYQPWLLNGKPVTVRTQIDVFFRLGG